ncbi:hypothetical protein TSOC_006637 [Tetrabaena socialis]|uniref:Uncharacterized protein n=1 Tax=Tetrabaena socialis TaxID=47790 RepID=A0A2J8A348_9CHLO|nr:hypothetical protein TSOC_006637 [Tetrabaena socialis]|eukprot:PNH06940.1 hypothetical protein TSOC_006637 [Tetrabaena socialis]
MVLRTQYHRARRLGQHGEHTGHLHGSHQTPQCLVSQLGQQQPFRQLRHTLRHAYDRMWRKAAGSASGSSTIAVRLASPKLVAKCRSKSAARSSRQEHEAAIAATDGGQYVAKAGIAAGPIAATGGTAIRAAGEQNRSGAAGVVDGDAQQLKAAVAVCKKEHLRPPRGHSNSALLSQARGVAGEATRRLGSGTAIKCTHVQQLAEAAGESVQAPWMAPGAPPSTLRNGWEMRRLLWDSLRAQVATDQEADALFVAHLAGVPMWPLTCVTQQKTRAPWSTVSGHIGTPARCATKRASASWSVATWARNESHSKRRISHPLRRVDGGAPGAIHGACTDSPAASASCCTWVHWRAPGRRAGQRQSLHNGPKRSTLRGPPNASHTSLLLLRDQGCAPVCSCAPCLNLRYPQHVHVQGIGCI